MVTNLTSLTSSLHLQIADNGMLLCMIHTYKHACTKGLAQCPEWLSTNEVENVIVKFIVVR